MMNRKSNNKKIEQKINTSDSLSLLLTYLSLIGIWVALPTVAFIINEHRGWPYALMTLFVVLLIFIVSYLLKWKVLFPPSSNEVIFEKQQIL